MSDVFYVDIDGVRQEAEGEVLDLILEDKKLAETKQAEADAKATAKTVLLEKLGITAEEAALLLS
jgi:hypothetical protein